MGHSPWLKEWNDIIRNVFFPDEELKTLMEVPAGTNIITFIDKYFIRAGFTSEVLTNEPVRVIYGTLSSWETNNPHVTSNTMTFDIYVKTHELHNVGTDRLLYRTDLIADRIKQLLLKSHFVADTGYHFVLAGEADLGTSVIGYSRKNVSFDYMKT